MASRTLLQYYLVYSILYNNQIETRTFNKTHNLEKNQEYDIFTTPVNKRSDDANDTDRNNIEVMKKIYSNDDQRIYTNAEPTRDMPSRNKYNRKCKHEHNDSDKSQEEQQNDDDHKSKTTIKSNKIELTSLDNRKHYANEGTYSEGTSRANSINRKLDAQTIATERVKQESKTKPEPNEELFLQNDVKKEDHPTDKKDRRQKQLTVTHRKTKFLTTQATTEKQLIPKITHKRNTEVENETCKTNHRDCKNHKFFEKISQKHDVYNPKHRDEFRTVLKHDKKRKANHKNMKLEHRDNKSHATFKKISQKNSEYKFKHRDVKKPVLSNTISMGNHHYERKHIDDCATIEEPVSKHNNKKKVNKNNTKIQHRDNKSHKTFKKSLQENSDIKLKHRDIEKPVHVVSNTISVENDISVRKNSEDSATLEESVSKHNIQKKVNKNKMKLKHRPKTSHRTFKTISQEKMLDKKHRDIGKPNTISMENDVYVQKHIDDFAPVDEPDSIYYVEKYNGDCTAVEEPVSTQVNTEYKPKFSHNFQRKGQRDIKVRKVRHTNKTKPKSKTKHDSKKVTSNQKKNTPTLNANSASVSETNTDLHKGENEINANSGDTLNPDDTPTLENQDEKETQESYENLLKQNDLENKPKLPFYISSTTKRVLIEIFKNQPKKLSLRDDEMLADILLRDLNTILKGKSNLRNHDIDLNTTISRLTSTKILDFITDRVAGQMLKKLEKTLATKNNLRITEVDPKKVEQIDILFKKNGDMVMMGPEQIEEKV